MRMYYSAFGLHICMHKIMRKYYTANQLQVQVMYMAPRKKKKEITPAKHTKVRDLGDFSAYRTKQKTRAPAKSRTAVELTAFEAVLVTSDVFSPIFSVVIECWGYSKCLG